MMSPLRIKSAIKPNKKIYFISPRVLTNQSTNYYAVKPNADDEKMKEFSEHFEKNLKKREEIKLIDAKLN